MDHVFIDAERIKTFLRDFQLLTNMRISFWMPNGQKLLSSSSEDNSQFCTALRQVPCLMEACKNCDADALCQAQKRRGVYTFICHAGLEESVCPIIYDNRLMGYLMIGQARSEDVRPDHLQSYWQHLERYGLNLEHVRELYGLLPFITKEKRAAAIQMLHALTSYVYLENLVCVGSAPLTPVGRVPESASGGAAAPEKSQRCPENRRERHSGCLGKRKRPLL